jgi:hypothetical protein
VSRSLAQPDFYTGVFPIMRNRDWERNAALVRHLVELRDRIRRLEAAQATPAAPGQCATGAPAPTPEPAAGRAADSTPHQEK